MGAHSAILAAMLAMLATSAWGQESSAKPEQPEAKAEAARETSVAAVGRTEPAPLEAAKPAEKEFVPPDGWHSKRRGPFTVYCRKDQGKGTRIPHETCYDEAGIRAMLQQQLDDRERVDQMRRICATGFVCATQ